MTIELTTEDWQVIAGEATGAYEYDIADQIEGCLKDGYGNTLDYDELVELDFAGPELELVMEFAAAAGVDL